MAEQTRIGKFLQAQRCANIDKRKTCAWQIINNGGDALGYVEWHSPWRKYVFKAEDYDIIFDEACLEDIARFLRSVKDQREEA